jgi:hypothetical protein
MTCSRKFPTALLLCLFAVLFASIPAHAYVDPNAAGLLSQILTPLLIAAGASLTFFRKRVGDVVSGVLRRFRGRSDA